MKRGLTDMILPPLRGGLQAGLNPSPHMTETGAHREQDTCQTSSYSRFRLTGTLHLTASIFKILDRHKQRGAHPPVRTFFMPYNADLASIQLRGEGSGGALSRKAHRAVVVPRACRPWRLRVWPVKEALRGALSHHTSQEIV